MTGLEAKRASYPLMFVIMESSNPVASFFQTLTFCRTIILRRNRN